MLGTWVQPREVWAVRISPDNAFLAAAGYDATLYLYDTLALRLLQKIGPYESAGPPAFIWTLEWSLDASRLAVGCWNGITYLYALQRPTKRYETSADGVADVATDMMSRVSATHEAQMQVVAQQATAEHLAAPSARAYPRGRTRARLFKQSSSLDEDSVRSTEEEDDVSSVDTSKRALRTARLVEIGRVQRSDRIYSIALDRSGAHVAIAGRDKMVGLYQVATRDRASSLGGLAPRAKWRAAKELWEPVAPRSTRSREKGVACLSPFHVTACR